MQTEPMIIGQRVRVPMPTTAVKDVGSLGIGFTGSHRTGKTTLAEKVAENNGFRFVQSPVSLIAKKMGIDFSKSVPFDKRMEFQETALAVIEAAYEDARNEMFVSDRTPLDFAAYLAADIPMELADPDIMYRAKQYMERCIELTNRYFLSVIVVQPGIPYVAAPDKPIPNLAYQESVATMMLGFAWDERLKTNVTILPRSVIDFDERLTRASLAVRSDLTGFYQDARRFPRC